MNARVVDQEDRDLEMMTRTNKMRRREEDERRAAMLYRDPPDEETNSLLAHRRHQLKRVFFTCVRTAPGLLFLGAIPRGWMDPGLALITAAACFVWALYYFARGYRHG